MTNDGALDSAPGTISILVTPANDPPTANDQSVNTSEDTNLPIILTASDPENDPLTYSVTVQPNYGTLNGTPPNVTYQPNADYHGPDGFTFNANDGFSGQQCCHDLDHSGSGSTTNPLPTATLPIQLRTPR